MTWQILELELEALRTLRPHPVQQNTLDFGVPWAKCLRIASWILRVPSI